MQSHQQQQKIPFAQLKNNNNSNSSVMMGSNNKSPYIRKTSAEIVSEAKSILAGGGARLVTTRRPITPKERERKLYGRVAPAGRPPSAFSLRYLQFESRALPSLEPILQAITPRQFDETHQVCKVVRSGSAGSIVSDIDTSNNNQCNGNKLPTGGKLPALLMPPKITASLDNLSEEMPPRKDFKPPKEIPGNNSSNNNNVTTSKTPSKSIVKDHPLKRMQTKSCDGKMSSSDEKKSVKTVKKEPIIIKTKLNRSNDLLAQSSTETLLDMLKAHAGIKECTEDTVQHINGILTELYTRVKGARGGWRGAVLGALYGLVECMSPKVLLSVARVVLALRVTGSNLTGACKLIFKVARNEVNDNLFIDCDVVELLIEGLGRASPIEEPEACIYGYGAVRFLASSNLSNSNNSSSKQAVISNNNNNDTNNKKETISNISRQRSLAYRLARHGAVQLIVLHLQMLNEAGAQSKLTGPPLHALYQLSGALRALAGSPIVVQSTNSTQSSVFTTTSPMAKFPQIKETLECQDIQLELAGPHLVKAAEVCIGEVETQANIIRTLSVLSELDNCCEILADSAARLTVLLGPCGERYGFLEKPLGFLSRLGYILGNIVAKWDSARIQIFNNDVAMEYLLSTLEYYSNQKFTLNNQMGDSVIDVIVKLVRVIANMCVNTEVGFGLGKRTPLGSILLSLILTANSSAKGIQMASDMEELLLATLGALHNLSFYQETSPIDPNQNNHNLSIEKRGAISERIADLSSALCATLTSSPISAQAEAARVLGNMTRCPLARQAVCNSGGLKVLVRNLQSEDFELVASSCGVLVNLLGDWDRRAPFRELKGPLLLRDVLQRSAMQEDWLLAGIVCQALWNFLIDSGNVIVTLGEDEADFIAGDLVDYLDEEKIFNGEPPDELWEQFASVATDLLERIQSSISITNSPCISSDDEEDIVVGEVGNAWGGRFKQWLEE